MIRNELKKNILSFEPHNERLCKLQIKGKFNNLSIISVHAPTEEKSDEEKEKFYEDLQIVHNKIPKHDIVIILGDLNAKIGKEEVYQNVAGKHTLHETSNRNGEWVCEYAIANNMKIISTYYQHKRIHKGTWISPDGNTLNQIDHVIIDTQKKDVVEDVRTMRGLNCDSDHFLVKTILRQRLIRSPIKLAKQVK
jgi:endonuclease/exonuclease/phosphatase family metal-dependent hydrolase